MRASRSTSGGRGRGDEDRLATAAALLDRTRSGAHFEDLADVLAEADVEHPVHFVEDGEAHVPHMQMAAFDHVHQAAGGAYHDLGISAELIDLGLDALPAVDRGGDDRGVSAQGVDVVGDLEAKLAGGDQDQALEGDIPRTHLEEGEAEGGGLAGAGAGLTQDVLALEHLGDQESLDLGGFLEAGVVKALHDAVAEAHGLK